MKVKSATAASTVSNMLEKYWYVMRWKTRSPSP